MTGAPAAGASGAQPSASPLARALDGTPGRIAVVVARLVVGGIFAAAAIPKLLDPSAFAASIANYHLVPDLVATASASVLPVLELVVALALVSGVQARGAAVAAGGMLIVFALAMTQAILRDINLDCGCFGSAAAAEVGWGSVLRNVGLTLLCGLIVLSRHGRGRTSCRASGQPSALDRP
jgi:uncharacterized membrane protein YphA (DoxX/SURF4 family)